MSNHEILNKYKHIHISTIPKNDVSELFTFLVRKLYNSGKVDELLTHNQMGNLVFNDSDSIYLKKVVSAYNSYFIHKGSKKKIDLEKIYDEHRYIWTGEKVSKRDFSIDDIAKALDHEISETYKQERKNFVRIKDVSLISAKNSLHIYTSKLLIENDDYVFFTEGSQAEITYNHYSKIKVTILEHDIKNDILSFQSTKKLSINSAKVHISSVNILFKLKDIISNLKENNSPLWKLIYRENLPNMIEFGRQIWDEKLDDSQSKSLRKAINNDITYIWGPPGTGKSHTLSRLLLNFYNNEERTVICAIANVAVDGLLEKTVDLFKDDYFKKERRNLLSERKIIRLGYSQSEDIRNIPEIKFENDALIKIAADLQIIFNELNDLKKNNSFSNKNDAYKLELISKKDELKKQYETESKNLLHDSKLIFLTSTKFILDSSFDNIEFDNLVIDEGSMMSIPTLMALARNVKKRIIVSGDFRQLGPIAISDSLNAKKWLHTDLFSMLGEEQDIIDHNALTMLTQQRRSASEIANLINFPFYNNQLSTKFHSSHNTATEILPSQGHISFIELPNNENNKAQFSKNRSKYNSLSRKEVINLVTQILKSNPLIGSIGIITPYRQQVHDYKKDLELIDFKPNQVRVGTIHTFQGSECDIIIWDIVDTVNQSMGILYKGESGERLVNVAISRAKSKLIIVGNHRIFHESKGSDLVSSKIKRIMLEAWDVHIKNSCNNVNYLLEK